MVKSFVLGGLESLHQLYLTYLEGRFRVPQYAFFRICQYTLRLCDLACKYNFKLGLKVLKNEGKKNII